MDFKLRTAGQCPEAMDYVPDFYTSRHRISMAGDNVLSYY